MTWETFLLRLLWAGPLVFLSWAALHDISHGEQDVWLEWSIVLLTGMGIVFSIVRLLRKRASHLTT